MVLPVDSGNSRGIYLPEIGAHEQRYMYNSKDQRNLDTRTYHEAVKHNGVDLYEWTCNGISLPKKIIVTIINKYVIFFKSRRPHIMSCDLWCPQGPGTGHKWVSRPGAQSQQRAGAVVSGRAWAFSVVICNLVGSCPESVDQYSGLATLLQP